MSRCRVDWFSSLYSVEDFLGNELENFHSSFRLRFTRDVHCTSKKGMTSCLFCSNRWDVQNWELHRTCYLKLAFNEKWLILIKHLYLSPDSHHLFMDEAIHPKNYYLMRCRFILIFYMKYRRKIQYDSCVTFYFAKSGFCSVSV